MQAYVGQTRSRALMARLDALGIGEIAQRHETPARRRPWVLDNGAFGDWQSGRPWRAEVFASACAWAAAQTGSDRPGWVVCPDRVATGLESLAFSLAWLDSSASSFPGLRWYLAVQDGMTAADVRPFASQFAGLFVGGTLPWKIETAARWVEFAHDLGKQCHIGRVGTYHRVRWARRIGADSIDSSLPLFSEDNLQRFLRGLDARPKQAEMGW